MVALLHPFLRFVVAVVVVLSLFLHLGINILLLLLLLLDPRINPTETIPNTTIAI
jgi:hypothetical protein